MVDAICDDTNLQLEYLCRVITAWLLIYSSIR